MGLYGSDEHDATGIVLYVFYPLGCANITGLRALAFGERRHCDRRGHAPVST